MPEWAKNRVVLGLAVFFLAIGAWEVRKSKFRPMYESGVVLYRDGHYREGLREFERAYTVAPNQVDVIVMVGWSNLKLRRYEEARFYFQRAQRIEPRNEEAQLGASFADWHTGRPLNARRIERLTARYPDDPDVRALLSAARAQERRE
jgi:tetratricopeptide (TPR) repeat protein